MKKANFLLLIVLSFLFIIPLSAKAYEIKTDNIVTVLENEVIEGNLYTAGSNITIDGDVNGDIFCAGNTISINGNVKGDIICAGNTININGQIEGSVRVIGNIINVNSSVQNNFQAMGATINLSEKAQIGWDMFVAGESAIVSGVVKGDLHGAVAQTIINGEIGKDIKLRLENRKEKEGALKINSKARVGGNVYYTSFSKGEISEEAQISGEIKQTVYKREKENFGFWIFLGGLASIFSALVVGLVLISLVRKPIEKIISIIKNEIGPSFGFGAVTLFLTPIIAFILMVTIIGIPLAVISLLIWGILLYIAKIVFSIFIGKLIIKKYFKKESKSLIWSMILGVTLVWLVASIPFIGWIFCLTARLWGLGAIIIFLKKQNL